MARGAQAVTMTATASGAQRTGCREVFMGGRVSVGDADPFGDDDLRAARQLERDVALREEGGALAACFRLHRAAAPASMQRTAPPHAAAWGAAPDDETCTRGRSARAAPSFPAPAPA